MSFVLFTYVYVCLIRELLICECSACGRLIRLFHGIRIVNFIARPFNCDRPIHTTHNLTVICFFSLLKNVGEMKVFLVKIYKILNWIGDAILLPAMQKCQHVESDKQRCILEKVADISKAQDKNAWFTWIKKGVWNIVLLSLIVSFFVFSLYKITSCLN